MRKDFNLEGVFALQEQIEFTQCPFILMGERLDRRLGTRFETRHTRHLCQTHENSL